VLRQADPEAPYLEDEIAEDFHAWATAKGVKEAPNTGRDKYSGKYLSEYMQDLEDEVERATGLQRPWWQRWFGAG
jgi:hypothetical protein